MADVNIQLGYKNTAWFIANATHVLLDGQTVYLAGNTTIYKRGDGATQLQNLHWSNAEVQSHISNTSNPHEVTAAQVGLGNVDNTSDANKPVSIATQAALDLKQDTLTFTPEDSANKGQPNGYPSLGSDGKIPSSELPAIALTDVFVVNSQAAQLALVAEEGDVAVRTDLPKTYIHNGGTSGTMSDWQEMLTPTDTVLSVNGQTGAVNLTTTNISEGTNLYFTVARVLSSALTGLTAAGGTPIATDTILQAFGKIKNFIDTIGQGITFISRTGVSHSPGQLFYDQDNQSLAFDNNEADIRLQIGQEEWMRCYNNTGATIDNGSAVYVSGNDITTGLPTIALARANSATTTVCVGLATHSIENGSIGYVTVIGTVRDINTSSLSIGNVFLSATTAGALTNTAPSSPNYRYRIGFVTKSNATTGTIQVTPTTAAIGNGTEGQVLGISGGIQQFLNANQILGYQGYTIRCGHASIAPADSTTYYFGTNDNITALTASQNNRRFSLPAGASRIGFSVNFNMSVGTGEGVTFRVANLTTGVTYTITTALLMSTINTQYFAPVTFAGSAGDICECQLVCPVFATNPTGVVARYDIYLS